jgi:hypothetical protein
MNKKGYVQDFLLFSLILFIFGIVIVVGFKLIDGINTNYQATDASSGAKTIMGDNTARFVTVFDWLFLTVFVLLMIAIFAGFFLLNTHPAFYFIVVILLAFMLIPIGILSNAFDTFGSSDSVSTEAQQFQITDFIFSKYALFFGAFAFIGVVVLFAKFKSGY